MPTADELKTNCMIVGIVQLPLNYNPARLDMGVEGSDRAMIVSLIYSITNTKTVVLILTNGPAVTHEKICEHIDRWVICIRYNPCTKSAYACCLHQNCDKALPTELVLCQGCMLPRFCSRVCASTDFQHTGICIPKYDPDAPLSEHVKMHMLNTHAFELVAKYNDELFDQASAFAMCNHMTDRVMDVIYKCSDCKKKVLALDVPCVQA